MFGSDPVGNGCCTFLHRREVVSDLRRENREDDVSILRKIAWRQVNVPIKEIGREVVGKLIQLIWLLFNNCRSNAIKLGPRYVYYGKQVES